MLITAKGWTLGLGVAVVLASSVALGDESARYQEAQDLLTKTVAVVNSVTTANKPESRQRAKALKSLAAAQAELACALAREANPKAACP